MLPVAVPIPPGHFIHVPRPVVMEADVAVYRRSGLWLARPLPTDEADGFTSALSRHGLLPCDSCVHRQCHSCPVSRYVTVLQLRSR